MLLILMNPPDPTHTHSLQADAEITAARNHTLTKHTCTNMTGSLIQKWNNMQDEWRQRLANVLQSINLQVELPRNMSLHGENDASNCLCVSYQSSLKLILPDPYFKHFLIYKHLWICGVYCSYGIRLATG